MKTKTQLENEVLADCNQLLNRIEGIIDSHKGLREKNHALEIENVALVAKCAKRDTEIEGLQARCTKATRLVSELWQERCKYRSWHKNATERAERYASMAGEAQRELQKERERHPVVLQGAEGWYPTGGSCDPLSGERVIVRNEPGTETFHTFFEETQTLFRKYIEWTYIPD